MGAHSSSRCIQQQVAEGVCLYVHTGDDYGFTSVMHRIYWHFEVSALLCSLGPQGSAKRASFYTVPVGDVGGKSLISKSELNETIFHQPFWSRPIYLYVSSLTSPSQPGTDAIFSIKRTLT